MARPPYVFFRRLCWRADWRVQGRCERSLVEEEMSQSMGCNALRKPVPTLKQSDMARS